MCPVFEPVEVLWMASLLSPTSTANLLRVHLTPLSMSLMKILKSTTPKTEPWELTCGHTCDQPPPWWSERALDQPVYNRNLLQIRGRGWWAQGHTWAFDSFWSVTAKSTKRDVKLYQRLKNPLLDVLKHASFYKSSLLTCAPIFCITV